MKSNQNLKLIIIFTGLLISLSFLIVKPLLALIITTLVDLFLLYNLYRHKKNNNDVSADWHSLILIIIGITMMILYGPENRLYTVFVFMTVFSLAYTGISITFYVPNFNRLQTAKHSVKTAIKDYMEKNGTSNRNLHTIIDKLKRENDRKLAQIRQEYETAKSEYQRHSAQNTAIHKQDKILIQELDRKYQQLQREHNAMEQAMDYAKKKYKVQLQEMKQRHQQELETKDKEIIQQQQTYKNKIELINFQIDRQQQEYQEELNAKIVEMTLLQEKYQKEIQEKNTEPNRQQQEHQTELINKIKKLEKQKISLQEYTDKLIKQEYDYQRQIQELQKNSPIDNPPIHLQNSEIRRKFIQALKDSQIELDIISPWVNAHTVNEHIRYLMENLLKKGVKIRIIYGIGSDNSLYGYDDSRSKRSDDVVNELRKQFKKYVKLFVARRDNTHEKVLICDNSYYIIGSYNFLSFDGDYSRESNIRKESAFQCFNTDIIRKLRHKKFNF